MTTPRRSARIASREPSVTSDDHAASQRAQANVAPAASDTTSTSNTMSGKSLARLTKAQLIDMVESQQRRITTIQHDLEAAESQIERQTITKMQRSMKMGEIMRNFKEREAAAAREAEAAAARDAPAPTQPLSSQTAVSPPPSTPVAAATTTPAEEPTRSVWRSFTSLFATPFSRKRAAEEETATPEPSQKRQKPVEPEPEPEPEPEATPITVRKPAITPRPAIKKPAITPRRSALKQPYTPRPAAIEEAEDEDVADTLAPAVVQQPSTTPAPKRKRTLGTATATPLPAIPESSPKAPMTAITPRPRTIASVRAAKSAMKPQNERRYAWETTPKPKHPNADTRIAKVREAENLRRRLAQLEQDEEVLRKVKRVKVDHLAEIPHNRPGDPSSTFRFPDIDSDDEIEVDESVKTTTNIFDTPQPQAPQETTPATATATPAPAPAPKLPAQQGISALPPTPQLPAQQTTTPLPPPSTQEKPTAQSQQSAEPETPTPRFVFPSVAPRPADYSVTPAYKEACGALFAAGLAAF